MTTSLQYRRSGAQSLTARLPARHWPCGDSSRSRGTAQEEQEAHPHHETQAAGVAVRSGLGGTLGAGSPGGRQVTSSPEPRVQGQCSPGPDGRAGSSARLLFTTPGPDTHSQPLPAQGRGQQGQQALPHTVDTHSARAHTQHAPVLPHMQIHVHTCTCVHRLHSGVCGHTHTCMRAQGTHTPATQLDPQP